MNDYKFENTVGGKLVKELKSAFLDCIVVPNHLLPVEFHDKVRGGRAIIRLDQMCDKRDDVTEHRNLKSFKAENIENYRKQYEENESFEYNGHVDELQLYKNQLAMSNACKLINEDDFLEN